MTKHRSASAQKARSTAAALRLHRVEETLERRPALESRVLTDTGEINHETLTVLSELAPAAYRLDLQSSMLERAREILGRKGSAAEIADAWCELVLKLACDC